MPLPPTRPPHASLPPPLLSPAAPLPQVRDHTEGCGGHDQEILSCNIDEAWVNLKIDYEAFDFAAEPLPQVKEEKKRN